MKLTLISIWFKGRRISAFVYTKDGKPSEAAIDHLLKMANAGEGQTIVWGG